MFPPDKHTVPFASDCATFIVDKSGKIAWRKVYEIGQVPDVDEVLQALTKLN